MSFRLKTKHRGIIEEEFDNMTSLKNEVEKCLREFQDLQTNEIAFELEEV